MSDPGRLDQTFDFIMQRRVATTNEIEKRGLFWQPAKL